MKNMFLTVFAALSLTATITPIANAVPLSLAPPGEGPRDPGYGPDVRRDGTLIAVCALVTQEQQAAWFLYLDATSAG
jgi:hypothetical protein